MLVVVTYDISNDTTGSPSTNISHYMQETTAVSSSYCLSKCNVSQYLTLKCHKLAQNHTGWTEAWNTLDILIYRNLSHPTSCLSVFFLFSIVQQLIRINLADSSLTIQQTGTWHLFYSQELFLALLNTVTVTLVLASSKNMSVIMIIYMNISLIY